MRLSSITRELPPAGVHLYPGGVSIVCTELRDGVPAIRGTRDIAIELDEDRPVKELYGSAIRQAIDGLGIEIKSCILAPQPTQVVTRRFKVEPGSKERHIRSAAVFEADEACDWSIDDRIMALDTLPETPDRLLSVARRDAVDLLLETAKEANVKPVAIDVPLAAWQRSLCDRTDALLDLTYERPALYVFADPMGEQRLLPPRLSVEKLAQAVRANIVEIRRQRISMVRKLSIAGKYESMADLLVLLAQDRGLESGPLLFGTQINPLWGFAAALATWSYAGHQRRKA